MARSLTDLFPTSGWEKKCYDALFSYSNTQGYTSIALLPLKINIGLTQLVQVTQVATMKDFIEQYKEKKFSIYMMLNSDLECLVYIDLLNRCINNKK